MTDNLRITAAQKMNDRCPGIARILPRFWRQLQKNLIHFCEQGPLHGRS
jgi:hypothetical protein